MNNLFPLTQEFYNNKWNPNSLFLEWTIGLWSTVFHLLQGNAFCYEKGDNLVVFYYLRASEIWHV